MRYNNVIKPRLPDNDRCLYNNSPLSKWQLDSPDPLSPVYARSRSERARAPTPIEHNGHIYDLVGVNSRQQLILRDQCALHLDIRIECFAGRAVILDGVPWQVDYLEAIPDLLDFTNPPRRILHLKRWTTKGQIHKAINEPDNLQAIFPGSRGKHTLGPIKHGIVRMLPMASRQRVHKSLVPGTKFEARLRGRELYGPFQIEAQQDGQLVAQHVLMNGFSLVRFAVAPSEISPSYVRVNCPDFGGCFDIDAFLYCEDKLRCRATSVKAIKAMRLPISDRDPMFGTLSRGSVPLLTNGLDHLVVFEKFIRECTSPSSKTPQPRRLTILNLSMCDQGDAKIVVDALVDFRKQNPDAIMSVVVSKLGPTIYQDTPACREYVKLLECNRIHIDMFTGVDGPTRQVVHAKAIVIDDRTLFSTGAIVDTKPIDKADFSIELPPTAAKAFQVYMQEAILGGVSNERRAHLGSQLASFGVIINDPIASLTYISRAQHTLLRGARRDLLVSVSELVDPKITKLLVRRAANGVTVTIQVREIDPVSSRILTQATRRYGKRLSVEDVSWWEPRPHYNAIIADDSLAYLGTSYFWPTQRNMIHQGRSLENGVLLEGESVKFLREQLDELRERAYSSDKSESDTA
jgi:phosphatidylserine/phosphatidylglycerophosphate/cardiolipin synthase-like enzyme